MRCRLDALSHEAVKVLHVVIPIPVSCVPCLLFLSASVLLPALCFPSITGFPLFSKLLHRIFVIKNLVPYNLPLLIEIVFCRVIAVRLTLLLILYYSCSSASSHSLICLCSFHNLLLGQLPWLHMSLLLRRRRVVVDVFSLPGG